ncbi:MAG: hypothetical protein Tp178MES00d2C33159851_15 [Prokaryotic dsDNA virus sp.]|nr:MAG: hypothetical protein Tp178MES00d2C33159851_15 [Prokaryotic dsDNA virus sp.]|tara:strand:- start:87678 stop:87896 length:219 start_codon:yes stop_codon:yes gene_type:complete
MRSTPIIWRCYTKFAGVTKLVIITGTVRSLKDVRWDISRTIILHEGELVKKGDFTSAVEQMTGELYKVYTND